ncbi:MAG: RagB/SusD family nutrient uptake outer membrane protein [Bacteroidales bacterium]|nr:RagB/SusD family nutrient uptake outer membrane protein [Bacteroidales bacterium]
MNAIKKITLAAVAAVALSSCDGFLDPYPSAIRDKDYVLSSPNCMQGLIGECYEWINKDYNNNECAYLDCMTDNAVRTSRTDVISRMATGVSSPSNDPFQTYWTRDYQGLYNTNLFLQNGNGRNLRYMLDARNNELLTDLLWGEAYALRAWFQWDLLQKFGGRGTNGELLGYPLILEPVEIWKMSPEQMKDLDVKRASYDDCVQQILADCDSAYKYLPLAHRDFLVTDLDDRKVLGSRNWGRIDGITTRAIKALVYLTWASPRFNPSGDKTRWENAAKYAAEVIRFKEEVDGSVSGGFDRKKAVNWFDPNSPEIVWGTRFSNSSETLEKMFYPGSFQGNGTMGATQDLVDAFGMADGYPLGESKTWAYDDQDPYVNRDPRLYSNIFYNNRSVSTGSQGKTFTFELWDSGKDVAEASSSNARTNYYIKKFVYMGLNWSDSSVNKMPRSRFLIRWTHMVLAYAEAANHVAGPNGTVEGYSAREAISWLRSRNTYDGDPMFAKDPYLEDIALQGEKAFDLFIRNERRIETCFEGNWFFDLRRWSTTLGPLNKDLVRPSISKTDSGFAYDYNTVVEKRSFSSAYLPIPYKEMVNIPGLIQNEGWDTWQ